MICEIMVCSSFSLSVAKLSLLLLLNILYIFRHIIYKWLVLFLFKRCKYGNISFIQRSAVLKPDLSLEQVEKELLNVVNHPNDPSVVIYITNEKFYENFLFYSERGLEQSFGIDFHTEHLYEFFEIIYAPPTQEWILYKNFVSLYNARNPSEKKPTLAYNDEEFLFSVDENTDFSSEEIKIVVHNGNFDFKNTSIENVLSDQEISKKFIYKRLERFSPTVFPDEGYYATFLKFLFQHNYLTYNHYFKSDST